MFVHKNSGALDVITVMPATDIIVRLAIDKDRGAICDADTELFDLPVRPELVDEFLSDPRHHLALALCGETIVGIASAVHYIHPDKQPQLVINEAAVLSRFRGLGIGRRLLIALCAHGRVLGCTEAWVATDPSNTIARRSYVAAGGKGLKVHLS